MLEGIVLQKAQVAYKVLLSVVKDDLRLTVPALPEGAGSTTLTGRVDAIAALGEALSGAGKVIDEVVEEEVQELNLECLLVVLASIKSRTRDLPVAELVKAGPDPLHEDRARLECLEL